MTKNADARMATIGISDPVARENFQRINRVFKDEFAIDFGDLTLSVQNIGTPDPQMLFHWHKVGRLITLSIDSNIDQTKVGTSNPVSNPGLPENLRPRTTQNFPVGLYNSSHTTGWVAITPDGLITWNHSSTWTGAVRSILYATSFTYVGV